MGILFCTNLFNQYIGWNQKVITHNVRHRKNVSKEQYRLAFAISMGGMLEFYDFMVYAMMASYIAENFFPSADAVTSLLETFATFAVGYLSRPLGGLFFGHLGDKYGRKNTFTLTISIMALTTALIGCLPTYDSVGVLAPVLLVTLRLFQGFSLGGELPGAMTYVSESSPGHSGLILGILFMSFQLGLSLGTFFHGLLSVFLSSEMMSLWGWRVPFWVGGLIGGLSYYIRRRFHESGLFLALDLVKQHQTTPLSTLLRNHRNGFFCGFGITAVLGSSATVLSIYMPGYLSDLYGFGREEVAWHTSLAFVMSAPLCVLMGRISDHFSHKWLLFLSILLIITVSLPFYHYIASGHAGLGKIMMVSGLLSAVITGLLPPMLVRLFPTEIRYTGVAAVYNLGFTLFGGLAPLITILLIKPFGVANAPAFYLTMVSVFALLVYCIPWPAYLVSEQPFKK